MRVFMRARMHAHLSMQTRAFESADISFSSVLVKLYLQSSSPSSCLAFTYQAWK